MAAPALAEEQHVALPNQAFDHATACRSAEVQADTLLAEVEREEGRALFAVGRAPGERSHRTKGRAAGRLD
jgi:hypothetical protein